MSIEEEIGKSISRTGQEKSYIDKVLSREDILSIRALFKKQNLTRSEILDLLNYCVGSESKLVNLGAWDRYIVLKFFIWIDEFIKISNGLYDYKNYLEEQDKKGIIVLSERTRKLFDNNIKLIEHNAKFLVIAYLNILRTSLSIGATGFMETLTNKFDISYSGPGLATGQPETKRSGGLLGMGGRKE